MVSFSFFIYTLLSLSMACDCAIAHVSTARKRYLAAHHVLVGFARTPVSKLKIERV
jgi:hypothetical protein